MATIVSARAFANNEVAFMAWRTMPAIIPGCLGFHIVREHLDAQGNITEERPLAAYVPFAGQHNPDWLPQNTGVWPVQKFNWRDLTLRRRRDGMTQRPENETVRYRIRAVGKLASGMEAVVTEIPTHHDVAGGPAIPNTYIGTPLKLGYLTPPAHTNEVVATRRRGPFTSTFTNGILSTQFIVRTMKRRGLVTETDLKNVLLTEGDPLRDALAGDVLTTIAEFFAQQGGHFHAALYELNDPQLIGFLKANAARLSLILSDAGGDKKAKVFDTTNKDARVLLHGLPGIVVGDRMFNGTSHIGHNKFVIWSDAGGTPRAVLTGSTNWTWSGVCGQSNNCIRIDDAGVAAAFKDYWALLESDTAQFHTPVPISAPNSGANQGVVLKTSDRTPTDAPLAGGGSARTWFSPNMPGKQQPPSGDPPTGSTPPDVADLFAAMRKAEHLILFAVFLPGRGGKRSIVEQAIQLGVHDPNLTVFGAISDSLAMWNYQAGRLDAAGNKVPPDSPYVFEQDGVSVVRATALTDRSTGGKAIGDFVRKEILTLGKAIIHDKIVVIDPLDPVNCSVAFGSHNLGYKASYSNDENMVIVRGHAELAQAYAVHVLDLYDHYRFRAKIAQKAKEAGTSVDDTQADGFLAKSDKWQTNAGRRLSAYFA